MRLQRKEIDLLREEEDEEAEDPLEGKTSKPKGRKSFPLKNRNDDRAPEELPFFEVGL